MRVKRCAPVLALALLVVPSAAAAKPSLSVTVSSSSQSQVLKAKTLAVSVYSKGKGSVRVGATGARATTLIFKKSGTQKAKLALTPAGRKALASCAAHPITTSAALNLKSSTHVTSIVYLLVDKANCVKSASNSVDTKDAARCDFLDKSVCLFPFPNDDFTKADKSTATGKRLNLNKDSMPANKGGVHIDPTDQNRADGFSPGNLIVTHVPGHGQPGRVEEDRRRPDQRHGALRGQEAARRGDRREDAQAAPDLDRARRQREEPRRRQPDHPAGRQLGRGAHLHRRPAQHEDEGRQGDRAGARVQGLPRQPEDDRQGRSRRAARTRRTCSGSSARRASSAATCTSPGTSPSRARSRSRAAC